MARAAAAETKSLFDASFSFCRSEFGNSDGGICVSSDRVDLLAALLLLLSPFLPLLTATSFAVASLVRLASRLRAVPHSVEVSCDLVVFEHGVARPSSSELVG